MQLCEYPNVSTARSTELMEAYKNSLSSSLDKRTFSSFGVEIYDPLSRQLRCLPQSLDVIFGVSAALTRAAAEESMATYENFFSSSLEKIAFPLLGAELYEPHGKTAWYLSQSIDVINRVSTGVSRAVTGLFILGESPSEEIKYLTLTDMAVAFDRSRVETNSSIFKLAAPRILSTIDRFKDVVGYWQERLAEHHYNGINRRLEYLFEEEPEVAKNQKAPSMSSFCVLMTYIASHPEFKTPSIGYDFNGAFSASWSGGKKQRVTVDFLGPTSVRWTFVDSHLGIENAITGAGVVPIDILQSIFDSTPYNASAWMKI